MKKIMSSFSALLLFVLFLPAASAQNACQDCKKSVPTEVHTSVKNAVTLSGPPDAKGGPVEFQIFTQDRDQKWKMVDSGVISKPGSTQLYKYYKPSQIMVLLYTERPYNNMVQFTSVKVAQEPKD
ncbi:MAG: hypothetical protein JNN28_18115 [Saprospiraceae bacterium]|nr:hypothetical protein [Saprospiraceae bacterium]